MKIHTSFAAIVSVLCAGCSKEPLAITTPSSEPTAVVDAVVGEPLPSKYVGVGNNMGAFQFVTVPVLHPLLRAEMQQVNLFTETESGLIASYRGDRAMESEAACSEAATRVAAILKLQFPNLAPSNGLKKKYGSADGITEAAVGCEARGSVSTLTLVVSNPEIEDRMMTKATNEKANKCVNIVRVAHSTRKPLRALLACYARRWAT
jgi:hypothetical protein